MSEYQDFYSCEGKASRVRGFRRGGEEREENKKEAITNLCSSRLLLYFRVEVLVTALQAQEGHEEIPRGVASEREDKSTQRRKERGQEGRVSEAVLVIGLWFVLLLWCGKDGGS